MKGYIQSLPEYGSPGYIEGLEGGVYAFYQADFSPADVRLGLKEWVSVEFQPEPGEVFRALNCQLVPSDPEHAPAFANTGLGALAAEEKVITTYSVPPTSPLVCKEQLPPEWEIIVMSNWLLRGTSKTGPDEAKRMLKQHARAMKANAILDVEYTTETAAGHIHQYQGRMAIVAKKNPLSTLTRETLVVDLDKEAEQELRRLTQLRTAALGANTRLYAACTVLVVLSGLVVDFLSLPMLAAAVAAAGIAAALSKNTRFENHLSLQPKEEIKATVANADSGIVQTPKIGL